MSYKVIYGNIIVCRLREGVGGDRVICTHTCKHNYFYDSPHPTAPSSLIKKLKLFDPCMCRHCPKGKKTVKYFDNNKRLFM